MVCNKIDDDCNNISCLCYFLIGYCVYVLIYLVIEGIKWNELKDYPCWRWLMGWLLGFDLLVLFESCDFV
jgi:hypothetical protein